MSYLLYISVSLTVVIVRPERGGQNPETSCTLLSAFIFQEYNCMKTKNVKEQVLITF